MASLLERALRLWGEPLPDGPAALALFREVYADPLPVNGEVTEVQVLLDRARMLQGAFEGLRHTVHEHLVTPGRQAFAFELSGRHTGPLTTPLGVLAPTGREITVTGLDVFLVD